MRRIILALTVVTVLMVAPICLYAGETETDFSYLEDMSVKDLRALRDAINEILGDASSSDAKITETEFPSVDENGYEISENEEHYKLAIESVNMLYEALTDPDSLEIKEAYYVERPGYNDKEIAILYTAGNKFGGTIKSCAIVLFNKDNSIEISSLNKDAEAYDWYKSGESLLNVDFLTSKIKK